MSAEHPELVFVTGPQQGQRVVLGRTVATLGRGGGVEIMLTEDFVSRRQARYELLQAGPVLENLSSGGTWINGKKYKEGHKVLLETGDVIGVGNETQILFVKAGDDVEAAVANFHRLAPTRRDAFGKKWAPPKVESAPAAVQAVSAAELPNIPAMEKPRQAQVIQAQVKPSEMTADDRYRAEQVGKKRKLKIVLGIYFGVILLALILGSIFLKGRKTEEFAEVKVMDSRQIADCLSARRTDSPALYLVDKTLDKAHGLSQQAATDPRTLYQCVDAYKLAMAYSGRGALLEKTADQEAYQAALDKLTTLITNMYKDGCILERDREWELAEKQFKAILGALIRCNDDPDDTSLLFKNVSDHENRAHYYRTKKMPGSKKPWM
jgi:pSer/pThr/pTyr-binding forkhead associated (FHA) protein